MEVELKGVPVQESTTQQDNDPSASSSNSNGVDVDEALTQIKCGRFQYLAHVIVIGTLFTFGYQLVFSYFIAYDPPWTCLRNDTSKFCEEHFGVKIASDNKKFSSRCSLHRDEWNYTTDKTYSVVTEYDLVCEKTALAAFLGSIVHLGGGLGIFISGPASDHYGRKYSLIIALIILTTFSIACSFVTSAIQLLILRGFSGAGTLVAYLTAFVYLSEIVPPNYRTIAGIGYGMGYPVSLMFIDIAAYYCRPWRQIQLYGSIPCIFGIALLFFLPKSPRWLLANFRTSEAETTVRKIAKFNGNPQPSITLKPPNTSNEKVYTYWHLFCTRKVAVLTLSLSFLWLTAAMAFYTITFESSNLGGDIYQAFAFSALAEMPSKVVAYFSCNRFGRKKSTLIPLVLTGAFAMTTPFIPESLPSKYALNLALMSLAKFFADIAVQGMYVWSFELFPTVLRLQGMGTCMTFERFGSVAAPFLSSVLHQVNVTLPHIILMVFTILAAAGALILPETNKKPTRERYEDFFSEIR